MRPDLDDFEEMNQDVNVEPRSRAMSWLVLGVAVGGFAALAYYAYQSGTRSLNDGNVLVVNAEPGAVKEAPANPGGEEFPNQDKTIYNAIAPAPSSGEKVEKLLPEPEQPVMPEPAVSGQPENKVEAKGNTTTYVNNTVKDDDSDEENAAPPQKVTAEETKPSAPAAPKAPAPVVAPAPAAAAPVAATPAPQEEKAPAPKPAPAPKAAAPAGAYKVQLGAFKSQAEAKSNWSRIQAAHGDIIKGSPVILRADLPNGTYYRLRASGYASADAAKFACTKLSAAGQACFYVGK